MFHLFSGLHTAILFSICTAKLRLKINGTKPTELNNLNRTIMKNTGDRLLMYPRTFIHRKLNNEDVKNNLDNFSMARRYGNPFSKREFVPYLNYESVPYPNVLSQRTNSFETNERLKSNELREFENDQIRDILYKQTILMEKFAQVIELEHYALRSKDDFENLLSEMSLPKIKNKPKITTTASTSTTKKQKSTIMTVVDETEVRNALKSDPLVKRILKMAERKRIQYVAAAKNYFKLR